MFGSEQRIVQPRVWHKLLYRTIGEFRYPLRLRAFYLAQSLPRDLSPRKIWDAGCGEGQTSFYLMRRFPDASLLGTDINPEMIDRCRRIAMAQQTYGAQFEVGDLVAADYEKAYELVVCLEVLEHIEDYETAINRICRALIPGGYVVIHTPAAGGFQGPQFGLRRLRVRPLREIRKKGQYHVRPGFLPWEITTHLEEHGLVIHNFQYTFGPLAMHAHTIYELARTRTLYKLVTYPLLMAAGLLDWHSTRREGGGILVLASKPTDSQE